MKNRMTAIVAGICMLAGPAYAGEAHWGYEGEQGPDGWARLDESFATCGSGKNQAPIDLSRMIEADLVPIRFDYAAGRAEAVNNGHTVQVNYPAGSSIQLDGRVFALKQFHFHAPSENTVAGKSFPMEAHFVHADAQGNLAVVAVMFEEGGENAGLGAVWASMPEAAGDTRTLERVDATSLLPPARDYYRFNGSLTTPPCTEGVRWLVLKTPMGASKAQLAKLTATLGHPNNRPVQPLNARVVAQ